jgi:3'-phosphoadenosine 5'-phosphosulfate sulfotransferase (PAPS reductase)/FAD synthetase
MKKMIGLSGGINSMAVLCWLATQPEEFKPDELHLFYAHFEEHSPGTLEFVHAGVEYAKKHFKNVVYKETWNSVIEFFRKEKFIPHPMHAPCTRALKITPAKKYMEEQQIDVDLVGYVRTEARRMNRMLEKAPENKHFKEFPIIDKDNDWCFEIVKKEIGWYPAIYDLKDENGKRVFSHNNCLPCKNMTIKQMEQVKKYYPEYLEKAVQLSEELKQYWGRSKNDFYTKFGREDYEKEYMEQPCPICSFD